MAVYEEKNLEFPMKLAQRRIIECAPDGILVVDAEGRIQFANPAVATLCGYTREALIGESVDMLMSPAIRQRHRGHIQKYFANPYVRTMGRLGNLRLWHQGGYELAVDISLSMGQDEGGEDCAILFVRDATEANAQRQQLEEMAMHDPLTGLNNRGIFQEQLHQALDHALRNGRTMAVCLVDLDDFKSVNDGYGHASGDDLLKETARRLKEGLRSGDLLARLGGDEFAVLLRDLKTPDDAINVARKIVEQLQQPITIAAGSVVYPGASVGVAYGPDDAQDAQTLMRYVDMALYRAKEAGRGTYAVYAPAMAHQLSENLKLRERLKHAMDHNLLALHYQPQIGNGKEGIPSVEALLRWHDPELGNVPPDRFIAVAESTGLILPLGDWVLDTACRQLAAWREQGLVVQMGVNVSAQQFWHNDLAAKVSEALERHAIPPSLLELEVTETAAMSDPEQAGATLNQLAKLGVGVALDDFGRGHSSLLYLLQLPVSRLKIDKLFISSVPHSDEHVKLTRAIIGLSQTLGKAVVAEGVETQAQLEFLLREGCLCCQGWLFSKAVPPFELPAVLDRLKAAGLL